MLRIDLERLYADEAGGLFAFLTYRTGDRGLAEDVLADTFERALRSRRRFDPKRGRAKTWVYSIALNRLHDLRRREAAEGRALATLREEIDMQDAAPVATLTATRIDLSRALVALTAGQRDVIALRYGGGLTAPETARVLRLPLTAVQSREHRALNRLRLELS